MAYDRYLKVDGIPGESTDQAHQGWIEIISFLHEVSQPAGSSTSRIGGRTGARVDMRDFCITKVVDKSSCLLHLYCCNGQHIPQIITELCEAAEAKHCCNALHDDRRHREFREAQRRGQRADLRAPHRGGRLQLRPHPVQYTSKDHLGKPLSTLQTAWSLEENRAL